MARQSIAGVDFFSGVRYCQYIIVPDVKSRRNGTVLRRIMSNDGKE